MTSLNLITGALVAALITVSTPLLAAEQASGGTTSKSEPIYGYRMMSGPERNEYREKMRNAKSADERQALRDGHHKQMSERAKERGHGHGKGPGYGPSDGRGPCAAGEGCPGPGAGRGPGSGKGPGYGPGPGGGCPAGQECPGAGRGPASKP